MIGQSVLGNIVTALAANPYAGNDTSIATTPKVTVNVGAHNGVTATNLGPNSISVGITYFWATIQFYYDGSGNITTVTNSINFGSSLPTFTNVIDSGNGTGGTGTINDPLFIATAVVTTSASVTFQPLLSGSQAFWMCGTTIIGPVLK